MPNLLRCLFPEDSEQKDSRFLSSIFDVPMYCNECEWSGIVDDCLPDVDGDGSLGCPKCASIAIEQW